jgi:hypothetical protein
VTCDHAQSRAFAATRGPKQAAVAATVDAQTDVVYGRWLASTISFRHANEFNSSRLRGIRSIHAYYNAIAMPTLYTIQRLNCVQIAANWCSICLKSASNVRIAPSFGSNLMV